jgi:hypothetical protein
MYLHAASGHAPMLRFDNDSYAFGLQMFPDAVCDFGGQALLNLKPLRKSVQNAC